MEKGMTNNIIENEMTKKRMENGMTNKLMSIYKNIYWFFFRYPCLCQGLQSVDKIFRLLFKLLR